MEDGGFFFQEKMLSFYSVVKAYFLMIFLLLTLKGHPSVFHDFI